LAAALMVTTASADTLTPGSYKFALRCGTTDTQVTKIEYTLDNVVNRTVIPANFTCAAGKTDEYFDKPVAAFNDIQFTYKCPLTNFLSQLYVPPPSDLKAGTSYTLTCPSGGPTPTPGGPTPTPFPIPTQGPIPTPGSGDAKIAIDKPVGGEQALPEVAGNADSGGSSLPYVAIAGAAAGLVVIGAGGWYARRRWLS